MTQGERDKKVVGYVSEEEKEIIKKASKKERSTVSNFVAKTSLDRAKELISKK